MWGCVVEVVGVESGGGEVFVDEVSYGSRNFLPLISFAMVETTLFGVEDCVDVSSCSNGT